MPEADPPEPAMRAASSLLPFTVRRLTPNLGAEISGLDLAQGVSPDVFRALYDAFLEHQVLLFPPGDLPPGAQVAFARNFGEVQVHVMSMYHADGFPSCIVSRTSTPTAIPTAGIRTRERSTGTPTARGGASPARQRSSTARSCRRAVARRTSPTCTEPTSD
jgi:hypothetical protein